MDTIQYAQMLKSRSKILAQKILSHGAVKLLEDFTLNRTSLHDFRMSFEDLIADMDSTPNFTPEAKALFGLELLLHEADDGFRDIEEAYTYARDLLQAEKATPDACPPNLAQNGKKE